MVLERTWRWFGEGDAGRLAHLKQMGVEGVVTSLHHLKPGEVWSQEEIRTVKNKIERAGLRWSVVESLPVSEDIKLGIVSRGVHIENYKRSLINLAECGIKTICYNFMPVLDWVRTNLKYIDSDGSETMLYDHAMFAAFDLFILERKNAEADYPDPVLREARVIYESMSSLEMEQLAYNIIIVTQGFVNSAVQATDAYKESFRISLKRYKGIGPDQYREHLAYFLNEVVPVAEEHGVRLCIHPDDPPFPVLGLPRIASTMEDFEWIFSRNSSLANGLTFCTGSLAARKDNDLTRFVKKFGDRIHFVHLRNLKYLDDTRFYESGHLNGDIDMFPIVMLLLQEQYRRRNEGRKDVRIPFRPDHGKKILDDFQRESNPGYPLVGRMKGLSELYGLQTAIKRIIEDKLND